MIYKDFTLKSVPFESDPSFSLLNRDSGDNSKEELVRVRNKRGLHQSLPLSLPWSRMDYCRDLGF